MTAADQPAADQPEQLAELLIADLETLRILADPIRLRILELLVLAPQPVKRLAATLQLPQTKLYYHINLLEEHGLIRVVGTRVISGIIEKQYGAVAQSYRIDEGLLRLSGPGRDDTVELMLDGMLEGVRRDVRQGLAAGLFNLSEDDPGQRKVTLAQVPLRLSPGRAAELHRRLGALIEEFCTAAPDEGSGAGLYHLFVAYMPTDLADQPDEGEGEG